MVAPTTTLITVPFAPTIYQQSLVDKRLLPEGNPTQEHTCYPSKSQISKSQLLVGTSTTILDNAQTVSLFTAVSTMKPTMQAKTVPDTVGLSTSLKPQPWTPIWPFMLKCELSNHPDKAFVRQLIYKLQHGCTIGYNGPPTWQKILHLHISSLKSLTQHSKKNGNQDEL